MCKKIKLPEKFLCRFPLRTGALAFGVIVLIILVASCIAGIYQVLVMKDCDACGRFVWRNAYACSVIGCLYCFTMLCLTIWYLVTLLKLRRKAIVTLIWLVMTGLWLFQSIALVIVMVCMYNSEATFVEWLLALVFADVAIAIFIYLYMVVVAYWKELKNLNAPANDATA